LTLMGEWGHCQVFRFFDFSNGFCNGKHRMNPKIAWNYAVLIWPH
jgi:hypothetical protein